MHPCDKTHSGFEFYLQSVSVRPRLGVSTFRLRWVFISHGALYCLCVRGRQDVRCLSARSRRWKAREGVEVAQCCSGNRLSSQKTLKNSLLLPSAFPLSHQRPPITTKLSQKKKPPNNSTPHANACLTENNRVQVPQVKTQPLVAPRFPQVWAYQIAGI